MKKVGFVLFSIFILSTNILSSESVDSLQTKYTPYLNPKYNYGFELNPGLILYALGEENVVISTGFSMYPKNRKTEIAIPLTYEYSKDGSWFGSYKYGQSVNLGLDYRHYLTGKIGGIYTSVGLRYNYAYLKVEDYYLQDNKTRIVNRLGIGFGAGYRIYSDDRLYWGIGVLIGGFYLGRGISDTRNISTIFTREESAFITIQLLKVGFAF